MAAHQTRRPLREACFRRQLWPLALGPTTNFYLGGSIEAGIGNVQVFGGWAFRNRSVKLGALGNQPTYVGVAAVTPNALSGFARSPFIGITYNLSGFVQSLFSGGGGVAK